MRDIYILRYRPCSGSRLEVRAFYVTCLEEAFGRLDALMAAGIDGCEVALSSFRILREA